VDAATSEEESIAVLVLEASLEGVAVGLVSWVDTESLSELATLEMILFTAEGLKPVEISSVTLAKAVDWLMMLATILLTCD